MRAVASDAESHRFPDLGSSVLTTMAFLEELAGEVKATIVDAPFVEGAVAAVVAAAAGLPLADVVAAAEETRGLTKL